MGIFLAHMGAIGCVGLYKRGYSFAKPVVHVNGLLFMSGLKKHIHYLLSPIIALSISCIVTTCVLTPALCRQVSLARSATGPVLNKNMPRVAGILQWAQQVRERINSCIQKLRGLDHG